MGAMPANRVDEDGRDRLGRDRRENLVCGWAKESDARLSQDAAIDRKPVALMGRAIVRDPKAFLMDEPLSNLDAKLRVQLRTEVARIQSRLGTTTVYVTHDQTEAMTLGDRVAVMRSGVLQQVGAPAELYNNPKNLFVAGCMGSPAMNFMPGELRDGAVQTPLGEIRLPEEGRARTGNASGTVIVGVRPESFEDASVVSREVSDRGMTFKAKIELVESLGAEEYAYFEVEGIKVDSDELNELAVDSGAHEVPSSAVEQVVARVAAESQIKRGQEADLWLDTMDGFRGVSCSATSIPERTTITGLPCGPHRRRQGCCFSAARNAPPTTSARLPGASARIAAPTWSPVRHRDALCWTSRRTLTRMATVLATATSTTCWAWC